MFPYSVLYVLIIIHTNKECRFRRKATSYCHLSLIPKQLFWDANSLVWFSTFQGAGFNLTKHFVKTERSFKIWLFLEFQVIFHFLKMPILFYNFAGQWAPSSGIVDCVLPTLGVQIFFSWDLEMYYYSIHCRKA